VLRDGLIMFAGDPNHARPARDTRDDLPLAADGQATLRARRTDASRAPTTRGSGMPQSEALFLKAGDGTRIHYVACLHEAAPASIVIVHGVGEYVERYTHVIDALHRAGYSCFGLDQRGFGRSGGVRGHIDDFRIYVRDLARLIDGPVAAHDRGPVFLLGHSMGSIVALSCALAQPGRLAGLVVVATPLILASTLARLAQPCATPLSRLVPRMKFRNHIAAEDLSCDPQVVTAFEHDARLVPIVTASWVREFNRACRSIADRAGEIHLPVMINHGLADRIASPEGGRMLYQRIGSRDKHLELYPGLRHELLNEKEPERSEVIGEIGKWLGGRCSRDA
jgi:alpha-beta hydrolase superfamily lysophospholipase